MSTFATIDSRRVVKLSGDAGDVTVTSAGIRLTFTDVSGPSYLDCPLGFAAIDVPQSVNLRISATLANGKAFTGPGTVTVNADTSNLSILSLDADFIQLNAGSDYTLGFQQALISRVGLVGQTKALTSTGAITIKDIPSNSDLTALKTDANDTIILNSGANYTITADQAKVAKVGTAGPAGNFTGAGVITIQANGGADLSGFTTRSTDIFKLAAGQDYVLTLAQAAIAKVDAGAAGDMGQAGNVMVKCPTADDLSLTPVRGIDVFQLTAGVNYTLNATQAASAKMGAAGAMGNLISAGVLTIKADTTDISNVVTDSNDIILLTKANSYTLTTTQLSRAKVGTTGSLGNLIEAGTIVAKANPAGEDLSLLTATGVDFIQLSPGKDYVLTSAQALISTVRPFGAFAPTYPYNYGFNLGNFADAGNITLKASNSEDLSILANTLTGIDIIQLTAGKNYSLTASQAKISRVDGTGTIGNLTAAGAVTVYADSNYSNYYTNSLGREDLSNLQLDSGDSLVLAPGRDYKLTALEASIATVASQVKGPVPSVGNLSKTKSIIIKANPFGEDISGLSVAGVTSIEITPGQKYTLTSAQAAMAEFEQAAASGQNQPAPTLTIKAQPGEDLTASLGSQTSTMFTRVYDAIQLAAGQAYTLTAGQALKAKVGPSGAAGNLSTAGAITLMANCSFDLSTISTPASASIVLVGDTAYTLTGAQALVSKLGITGAVGNIASSAVLTILAGTQSDLSSIQTDSDDIVVLSPSLNYTLTSSEARRAKVGITGVLGDLSKAGTVSVKASAGEDLTLMESQVSGVDFILLTAGTNYTLTPAQLLISKLGAAGTAGQVASAGIMTVVAKTSADLSLLNTDGTDLIYLKPDNNYTLTSAQAQVASITTSNQDQSVNVGNPGALDSNGTITIKASTASTGEDLSKLVVQGVDAYQLTAGVPYTLTAAQASIAKIGTAGMLGNLASTAVITINAAATSGTTDLSRLQTDSNDILLLSSGQEYRLTAAQAAISKVVSAGVTGAAGSLGGLSKVTIDARAGGVDLSKLLVDSGDVFWLAPGQKYTMTTAQAAMAQVVSSPAGSEPTQLSLPGDLRIAGAIKLIASPGGNENLTNLATNALDVIQLTDKQAYTLTAAQATIAQVGAGAVGNLLSAGTITVIAGGPSDLSSVLMDKGDQIILTAGNAYTLNPLQAGIAKVGADTSNAFGDLTGATVLIKGAANTSVAAPEDLTALSGSQATGYILSAGQNYVLTATQAQISSVISPTPSNVNSNADLTKAGVITIKASVRGEDLSSALDQVKGVDVIQLTSSADYTLTAAQLALAKVLTPAPATGTSTGGITAASTTAGTGTSATASTASTQAGGTAATSSTASSTASTGTSATSSAASAPATGVLTVLAKYSADLSTLTNTDSNDLIFLAGSQNYTLTTAQAQISSVVEWDIAGKPVIGSSQTLVGTGNVIIKASPAATGEDLTKLNIPGVDTFLLTPGSAYTLTVEQAKIAKMGAGGLLGNLTSSGVITINATLPGSDLSGIQTDANDIIQLADTKSFTLTAAQAAIAKIGTSGTLGILKSDGKITIDARSSGGDLSKLALDSGDLILLAPGQKYTMTTAQAAIAKVVGSPLGDAGDLRYAGAIKLIANPLGDDLSASLIKENPLDIIQLTDKMPYTLSASQALTAQVGNGAVGNLLSTGAITIVAGPVTDPVQQITDLSPLSLDKGDTIILTSNQGYILTSLEASIAKVSTLTANGVAVTGNVGALNGVNVTLKASATGEDLSALGSSGIAKYVLALGQNYTLAPSQLALASVYISGNVSGNANFGDLTKAGYVTVKADATGGDLSTLSAGALKGVDAIQLTSGGTYTLTPQEALIAKVGATGTLANLVQPGVVTVDARDQQRVDLSGIGTDAGDIILLQSGNDYTLTTAQATRVKIYSVGTNNVNTPISGDLGVIDAQTKLTLIASSSTTVNTPEDLTALPPGFDAIQLVSGQSYVMTSEQALIAYVGSTPNANALHDLSKAGMVTIKSSVAEDLSRLLDFVNGVDQIQLKAGLGYTLDFSQALVSKVGPSGALGDLRSDGTITVSATQSADMTSLVLDKGDRIVLTPGVAPNPGSLATGSKYILSAAEVAIATIKEKSTLSHDAGTQIILKANSAGEDLSGLAASYIDSIILATGQNYNLTPAEAALARVGLGNLADLSKAGKVTLTVSGTIPSTPLPALGIDILALLNNNSMELYASTKISPTNYGDFSSRIQPIASGTTGGTAGPNSIVDATGEWKFDAASHLLTVWDGQSVQSITLAGVNTLSVSSNATAFTIG